MFGSNCTLKTVHLVLPNTSNMSAISSRVQTGGVHLIAADYIVVADYFRRMLPIAAPDRCGRLFAADFLRPIFFADSFTEFLRFIDITFIYYIYYRFIAVNYLYLIFSGTF